MAKRAFKREFAELAAKMPPVPDLRAANDARDMSPQAARRIVEARLQTWLADSASWVEASRNALSVATTSGLDEEIWRSCEASLQTVVDTLSDLLKTVWNDGKPVVTKAMIAALDDRRDQVLALILDFDPDAYDTDRVATTPDEIEAWFKDLPLSK
ncbi:MAG: hypothetical protein P0Y65_04075 [Candidatus Devosia phytovorans]|uniref:Uncharacterized protein n=1 Tax=Candidatus Devosia phytovorans TaxID=3121372 RepID=A0AAJ5VV34_9HYPH|nr:hypothetical protein [Devosia sp.]WEK05443.1 MAG: hypothetical protein P0Y65_04075 [Devosia sp.]